MLQIKSCDQSYHNSQDPANAAAKLEILVVFPVPHFRPNRIDHEKQTGDDPTNIRKNALLCYVRYHEAKEKNSHRNLDLCLIGQSFHDHIHPFLGSILLHLYQVNESFYF